jgi:Tfp pilus assembly protein PilO
MFLSVYRRILIYAIFWGLVLIAFYFSFWRVSLSKINQESDSIIQTQKMLTQMQKYIADWPITAQKELEQAEENLEEFLAQIPDEEDIPEVLRKIQEYGIKSSRLNLSSIENITKEEQENNGNGAKKQVSEEEKYAKSTYQFAASGNYFDVIRFLRSFETMERLVNVEEFSLKYSGDDEDNINLDLAFSVFYSRPER